METIEVVVRIPKGRYETLVKINNRIKDGKSTVKLGMGMYEEAIVNGTVLPKGHGKLFDINEITAFKELECNGHNIESLDEFTTIIEADKIESEDKT